jgi:hypothetical protein
MKLQVESFCYCGKHHLYAEPLISDSKNLKELKKEEQIKSLIKLMKYCYGCNTKNVILINAYDTETETSYPIYKKKNKI